MGRGGSTNGSRKNLIKADDAAGIFIFCCCEKWKSGQVAQADFILNVAIASKAFGNGVGRQSGERGEYNNIYSSTHSHWSIVVILEEIFNVLQFANEYGSS